MWFTMCNHNSDDEEGSDTSLPECFQEGGGGGGEWRGPPVSCSNCVYAKCRAEGFVACS